MRHFLLTHRVGTGLALVAVIAVAAFGIRVITAENPQVRHCALMPDSIGLFVGSSVTVMGLPVGDITAINPADGGVRVEFDLPRDQYLPASIGASSISTTLVADRSLALISAPESVGRWQRTDCITATTTPQSMTQSLRALSDLARDLTAGGTDPEGIGRALAAVEDATAGSADEVNRIIRSAAEVLDDSDAGIAHLASSIDSLAALSDTALVNWPEISATIKRMTAMLTDVADGLVPPIIDLVDKLQYLLPMINDLTLLVGGPLVRTLNSDEQLPRYLAAGIAGVGEVIELVPGLASAFTSSVDPDSRRFTVGYRPPRVSLPAADAPAVCAAVNAVAPGRCRGADNGLVDVDLTTVILGTVGAR